MIDPDKFKPEIPKIDVSKFQFNLQPAQDALARIQQEQEASMRALQRSREEKEAEELRRHNELVAALKEAGEKGATIIVGDNAAGVQIQQNSAGASQTIDCSQGLNFEQVRKVLTEIQGYFDIPQFKDAFGENADNVKSVVNETLKSVEKGESESLIKKSLRVLRDIVVGAAGSLVGSGILGLLGTLPIG
jgi:hypothetical protein